MNREFWKNKNVLVTGAGGFKGSHLVEHLSKSNCKIISLVRDFDPKSYFELKNLGKKSIVVIGDLKDYRKIADIISKYEITSIFHLGAQPLVTTAMINPLETLESNIMGTVNVLEAARIYGKLSEIVVVSSDKAYGPTDKVPYKEDERLQGKAPYDVSKSCADLIAQMYARIYNLPVTVTRCANVFGPGDLNMNRIIPGIIEAIIKNKVLEIRSDGKMIREYIYVKDSIEAYIKLAENIYKSKGQAFNISGHNIMSVLDVVKRVSSIVGKPIRVRVLNKVKTEIPKQYLDGSKMKEFFLWEPKIKFEEAIIETYDWYLENL
jgi:CDP-glucose 4,6-dehydratase